MVYYWLELLAQSSLVALLVSSELCYLLSYFVRKPQVQKTDESNTSDVFIVFIVFYTFLIGYLAVYPASNKVFSNSLKLSLLPSTEKSLGNRSFSFAKSTFSRSIVIVKVIFSSVEDVLEVMPGISVYKLRVALC